jgi:trimeric autotransporter adhesin
MRTFSMLLICVYAASYAEAADRPNLKPSDIKDSMQGVSVTVNPTSVIGGALVTGTVTLQHVASGVVTVNMKSSSPTIAAVPTSVFVQPGATTAIFVVQTYPVTVNPNVVADPPSASISAQVGAATPSAAKLVVLPPTLASFAFNPASVPGGVATSAQVSITGPAPSGGVVITLSQTAALPAPAARPGPTGLVFGVSHPPSSVISMPAQVTVVAGVTSASFSVGTKVVAEPTSVQVSATRGVYQKKTATLTVQPPSVASISFSTDFVIGGAALTGTVKVTSPAPSSGMAVQFVFNDSNYICGPRPTMPANIQVPAASTSVTFPVTTYPGYGIYYVSAGPAFSHFLVAEPYLSPSALVLPSSVKGGTIVQAKLQLSGNAMPTNCGNQYQLKSSNTLFAQVPPYVTVAPGTSVVTFPVTTTAVGSNQTVTLTVTSNLGYSTAQFAQRRDFPLTLTP